MAYKNIYTLLLGITCLASTASAENDLQKMGLNGKVKTYTCKNGTAETNKYTFNEKGMLTLVENKSKGEIQTIKYNADGEEELRLVTLNGALKDSIVTAYRFSGKKKATSTKYYDETKKLVKADDKWFDEQGRLIKHREIVVDQEGILHGYHYADDGEKEILTRFFDDEADGSVEKTYDANHNFVLEVDMDEKRKPISRTSRTFSKKGLKTSETVETFCLGIFNGKTTRQYDKKGLLIKEDIFDKNNQLTIGRSVIYNKKGKKLEENYTDGKKTAYKYDNAGNMTEKTETTADGKTRCQQFSYDNLNNMTMHKDANGQTNFVYEYYAK